MKNYNPKEIEFYLNYPQLIEELEKAFQREYVVPARMHYDYKAKAGNGDSTLLLMPAWQNERYVGLKVITISPHNPTGNLPTIQGIYLLMNAKNGQMLAQFDAGTLTNLRTAATSALASKYLSRSDAAVLLMVGTGALAPELIKAHCMVRPIKKVMVWGRNFKKAMDLSSRLNFDEISVEAIDDLNLGISNADIISTATSSPEALVFGDQLKPGQHLDLVGAFKPTWREADDNAIINSSVFIDTREGTLNESGELLIPIEKGLFHPDQIKSDLFELCKKIKVGRVHEDEITSFISVGYALEDLAAAELIWKKDNEAMKGDGK